MAQATDLPTTSRFHNPSNAALADTLGNADPVSFKGAEVECKALKDEIKRRGLLEATGDGFTIRVSEQISGRLDVAAVKQHLGDAWRRFEVATVTTVVRIKAVSRSRRRPNPPLTVFPLGSRPSREPSPSSAFKEPRYEQIRILGAT